ncbi:RHS repeat domain-containing protein [Streptococcus azizii]|uniref:RHS repeat domain-containing protein n=1 Tax=Streptococcus azizii TaxID=1579424 RepID=UPI00097BB28A|nr:hypothetical protein [Streptococcus azizii]ONK29657.1 hypothetical protein BVE85_02380 [Streptococcus azizii]
MEIVHRDKKDKLISSYAYEYDDGNYITKETITQDGETLIQAYTYDSLGQVISMVVTDKEGKELSSLTYSYDLAGNKLTSTETIEGKEETTRFTYDDHNRLIKLENKDGTTSYTYDKNGNRISSQKNDEKLDYIYDTENRLLAVKDKAGLLFAALYDGDDNRVFTASRKEGKHSYQLFKREDKRKSPTRPQMGRHIASSGMALVKTFFKHSQRYRKQSGLSGMRFLTMSPQPTTRRWPKTGPTRRAWWSIHQT